jgi:hypothetical protein
MNSERSKISEDDHGLMIFLFRPVTAPCMRTLDTSVFVHSRAGHQSNFCCRSQLEGGTTRIKSRCTMLEF